MVEVIHHNDFGASLVPVITSIQFCLSVEPMHKATKREPRIGKSWFLIGIVVPNENLVDAVVNELFKKNGPTVTADDFTRLSGRHV
jgi:hypothetical protein